MKLKYNHKGQIESIPLSKKKPEGKRLAVRHDDQNFYAPLVDAGDATASNLRTTFKGEMLAVRQMPAPEIENILIAPPRVSVMQGQSATATVSAEGNEAVAGLSYSLTNPPTWITISDDMILIRPSDNDLGEAIVEVLAKDTGSDASASAAFVAESLLRPIIESLSVIPPAVTVQQGSTSTAIVQAVANSAVGGLSYSLDGAPSWVSLDQDTIHIEPTTNDTGTSTVQVVAYDTNSSARADTSFTAVAAVKPRITRITTDVQSLYSNHDTPNKIWVTALDEYGRTVDHTIHIFQFSPSTNAAFVDSPSSVCGGHYISVKLGSDSYTNQTGTISVWLRETTGVITHWSISLPIKEPATPTVSLQPAKATLRTGTSGNQTVTLKATVSNKIASYWEVHGYFPKNSTITPSVGFTSRSSVASLKVVYPKADQTTASETTNVGFVYTPPSASINSANAVFVWASLSSNNSNSMYYAYIGG